MALVADREEVVLPPEEVSGRVRLARKVKHRKTGLVVEQPAVVEAYPQVERMELIQVQEHSDLLEAH